MLIFLQGYKDMFFLLNYHGNK